MSKRYDEAIEVTSNPARSDDSARLPVAFRWRGRRYEIDQCLASWREGAEWWQSPEASDGARVPKDRDCFRVLARAAGVFATGELDADGFMLPSSSGAPSAVYDLAFDRIKKAWRLSRIWD